MGADTPTIELRPATAADAALLYEVYASTRYDVHRMDWPLEQRDVFLRQQFDLQRRAYADAFPDGNFSVIVVDGVPVGRLYLHETPTETRIIDIALLPTQRRRGVGTRLLHEIMAGATGRGASVTLHVVRDNDGAREFYDRLGFIEAGPPVGAHHQLRWESPIEATRRLVIENAAARDALLGIRDVVAFAARTADVAAAHGVTISPAEVTRSLDHERQRIRQRWV